MIEQNKKSVQEIEADKAQRIMETVAWRAGFYRANPHRFVEEVLEIHLKLFQKILLYAMMHYNYLMYLASRGQGKTFLTAIFAVVYCILFPGTIIVVSSGTLKQANEVLLKIENILMKQSSILRQEISFCNIGINDAIVMFKNTSFIVTRVSNDNARSARANILIIDEARLVDKVTLNTVLRKFLTSPRHPRYLDKPEYEHLQERNKEIYMSSAYFKSSELYEKAKSYTVNFFDDTKKYFICGLPYQVSIKENLLMRSQVEDERSEADYNEITDQMEMECLWFGDTDGGLFKFDDLNNIRRLKLGLHSLKFYNESIPVPKVSAQNKRILSVDIALMASNKRKRNDATAIYINDALKVTDVSYQSNMVFGQTFEGLTTDKVGIIVMRYFYEYNCTDLVLDTNGNGLGVYDFIIKDQYDSETGKIYKALCAKNNQDMADRCKVKDANKVVWCVKATSAFNNEIALLLRNGIKNGKINFLISELNCEESLAKDYKPYKKLNLKLKDEMKMPYVETTMAVYELIKLKHYIKNGNVVVVEPSGFRKDRYSSIAYNFWCVRQLELELRPSTNDVEDLVNKLTIRKGSVHKDR